MTEAGVLLLGEAFKDVSAFEHEGHTDLFFDMDDVSLDIGKLAIWRLRTHSQFGGTWLSDFVPNHLGGFVSSDTPGKQQPNCPPTDQTEPAQEAKAFEESEADGAIKME